MAEQKEQSKIQQDKHQEQLLTRLSQVKQTVNALEVELEKQQTLLLKLIGALEYHEILFPPKESK